MKNKMKQFGIIALVVIIGLSITACEVEEPDPCASCLKIGATGEGGGKIFFHNHSGFTVIGTDSFTAYYLEAAPVNQGASLDWASMEYIISNNGIMPYFQNEIGTGKENTRLMLTADGASPAALACKNYIGGGKTDWFLPSLDELGELYKQRNHFGITTGYFWISRASSLGNVYVYDFSRGDWGLSSCSHYDFTYTVYVRAIRAF